MTRLMRGKITGSTVRQIPSSSLSERALTVQFFDDDARVFDLIQSAGVDSNPAQNSAAFISDGGRPSVIATRDGITPAASLGEIEIYSTDSPATVKKARIKAKSDGTAFIGSVTNGTDLLAVINGLIDIIKGAGTMGGPNSQVIDATTQTALQNYKTTVAKVLSSTP